MYFDYQWTNQGFKKIHIFNIDFISRTVADPGLGQGGAKNFFPRFCRRSEAKSSEQSEQYNISI